MAARIKRLLKLAAAVLAFLVYVWFAAVRNLPVVKRRKARRRARAAAAPPGGGTSAPTSTVRASE